MKPVFTVDYHTAGEPFRIVEHPPAELSGETVVERRANAVATPDTQRLREFLCFEPRGHADMYGGFIVPPDDDGAHLGVLFCHKGGFSTACGHGAIALGAGAVHSGLISPDPTGTTDVGINVPSGRVTAQASTTPEDRVTAVDFVNVLSHVLHRQVPLTTSRGQVSVDVAYGGAIYAQVPAGAVDLEVSPEHYSELIAVGREIKWVLNSCEFAQHPTDDRHSGIYGTILFDDLGVDQKIGSPHQRNITVFADGEVDRSPCCSLTSPRLAALAEAQTVAPEQTLIHYSVVGTRFHPRCAPTDDVSGYPTVTPLNSTIRTRWEQGSFNADDHTDKHPSE
ncbi:proline racemase family protein [Nesterenkonia muleiensis]|uniref:proline racemase family protein n=1 Tax=Nesterenkonia muleiensis TaxID=2282648 RepID=UPI000E76948A|nr:proline racemase family protein [Nesterenkonia muleiensis]